LVKGREAGIIYLDQELTDGKSTVLLNLMSTFTSFDSIFVSRLYSKFARLSFLFTALSSFARHAPHNYSTPAKF
jgi:hypothetical protein